MITLVSILVTAVNGALAAWSWHTTRRAQALYQTITGGDR